jgi:hypothetical protein
MQSYKNTKGAGQPSGKIVAAANLTVRRPKQRPHQLTCVHNKLHFLNSLAAFAVCLSCISWSRAGSSTPAARGLKCRRLPLCFVQFAIHTLTSGSGIINKFYLLLTYTPIFTSPPCFSIAKDYGKIAFQIYCTEPLRLFSERYSGTTSNTFDFKLSDLQPVPTPLRTNRNYPH